MGRKPRPAQDVSLSISAFEIHVEADGHTGWAAWRRIRRSHPMLAQSGSGAGRGLTASRACRPASAWPEPDAAAA
ncbi:MULTISPECIES: hypothetical protein [unclassified Streptomyces]|uniref:hypothetical protein n=1 Tax=unclassified Streptomyces TaxID=2593676 RepID=UPI0035D604A5